MKVKAKDWRGKTIDVDPIDVDYNGNQPIMLTEAWIEELGVDDRIMDLGEGFYYFEGAEIEYVHELQLILAGE